MQSNDSRFRDLGILIIIIVLLFLLLRAGGLTQTPEATAKLTEVQQLKADNHKLKVALAQLQAQFNECQLNGERAVLTADFMKTLGGESGEFFDWNTLSVKKEQK